MELYNYIIYCLYLCLYFYKRNILPSGYWIDFIIVHYQPPSYLMLCCKAINVERHTRFVTLIIRHKSETWIIPLIRL
jgi:hypothetical protein